MMGGGGFKAGKSNFKEISNYCLIQIIVINTLMGSLKQRGSVTY